jgi:hypothetical protein
VLFSDPDQQAQNIPDTDPTNTCLIRNHSTVNKISLEENTFTIIKKTIFRLPTVPELGKSGPVLRIWNFLLFRLFGGEYNLSTSDLFKLSLNFVYCTVVTYTLKILRLFHEY